MGQDYELWLLLAQVKHVVSQLRGRELRKLGITPEQARVLYIVKAAGGMPTPAVISRWMLRRPHTVSALVNRMEKKGLVRKTRDSDRKNLVKVSLTRRGQQAYEQSAKRESIRKIMSPLSQEERQQLKSHLQKLRRYAFKEFGIDYKNEP